MIILSNIQMHDILYNDSYYNIHTIELGNIFFLRMNHLRILHVLLTIDLNIYRVYELKLTLLYGKHLFPIFLSESKEQLCETK